VPVLPALVALLLAARTAEALPPGIGIGFCIEDSRGKDDEYYAKTGFVQVSGYNEEAACVENGHSWCPLLNVTDTWTPVDGAPMTIYYWYSACCTNFVGSRLKPDPATGLPTCKDAWRPSECAYHDWAEKLSNDLLGLDDDGRALYDVSITPGIPESWITEPYWCLCEPEDPRCIRVSDDGAMCLVCENDDQCGPNPVRMGFQLFKVLDIDMRTSKLSLSVWFKQEWYDRRLAFDKQCYGGIHTISAQAKSGSLPESRIWSPDIELLNSEKPLWGGFSARLATVHGCWDGKPTRGGCGFVQWSAPGVLEALCKWKGLAAFPYDILSCELELAGWASDGIAQDILPRVQDGGIAWVDDPTKKVSGGVTAGSSYQDYSINSISLRRIVTQFDCCLWQPWPGLIYEFSFTRSGRWYESKLVLPMIVITLITFVTFWLHPKLGGERLSFGILALTTMLTHDIIATEMLPICNERTFLSYLSVTSQTFAELSLLITGIVLFIYQQEVDTWEKALVPVSVRRIFLARQLPKLTRPKVIEEDMAKLNKLKDAKYQNTMDAAIRDQCYRIMFHEMDKRYTGFVEPEELVFFGSFITGSRFRNIKDLGFVRVIDECPFVIYEDFVTFCETKIEDFADTEFLKMTCEHFLEVSETREHLIKESWEDTAFAIDSIARWALPFAYCVFLMTIFGKDYVELVEMESAVGAQTVLMITPVWPICIIGGCCGALRIRLWLDFRRIKRRVGGEGGDVGSAWYRSYSIEQDEEHRDDYWDEGEETEGGHEDTPLKAQKAKSKSGGPLASIIGKSSQPASNDWNSRGGDLAFE